MRPDGARIAALIEWMGDGARSATTVADVVGRMCEELAASGVPVDRFALFLYTLHPLVRGRRHLWVAGEGVAVSDAPREIAAQPEFQATVAAHVMRTGERIRVRIAAGEDARGFCDIAELIEQGMSDYLIQPLVFTNGDIHAASWATRAPGGFDDTVVEALDRLRPALARLAEAHTLRLDAANLLNAYVGRDAGARILAGHIERGDAERIEAVILFFDLKDFTRLSNTHEAGEVIALLNRVFDHVVAAVEEEGGEVLKFLGDGLIAIFPSEMGPDGAMAALRALGDVHRRLSAPGGEIGYRASLHIGSVLFGNVGARHRLDFTAIGPAVNLAARLIAVGSETGADWVCSQQFAALSPWPRRSLGLHQVKGFDRPVPVYALANDGLGA